MQAETIFLALMHTPCSLIAFNQKFLFSNQSATLRIQSLRSFTAWVSNDLFLWISRTFLFWFFLELISRPMCVSASIHKNSEEVFKVSMALGRHKNLNNTLPHWKQHHITSNCSPNKNNKNHNIPIDKHKTQN